MLVCGSWRAAAGRTVIAQHFRTSLCAATCIWAILLSLGGCSTQAQIEASQIASATAGANASFQACTQNVANNPEYAPIELKTPISAYPQWSLQMLNDNSSPSKKEILLLYRVYGDMQECRKIPLDAASKMHPLLLLAAIETYSESDKLWAQVTAGRLRWGQFNQGRKQIYTGGQEKVLQANTQISAELNNQHYAELEERERAAAAFQEWASQQQQIALQAQAIATMNRPRVINCSYLGATAQCISN
jgi:hypothetical protein